MFLISIPLGLKVVLFTVLPGIFQALVKHGSSVRVLDLGDAPRSPLLFAGGVGGAMPIEWRF